MKSNRLIYMAMIGALCAIVGAAAGIAGSSGASKSSNRSARAAHMGPPGPFRLGGGPPVHVEAIVPNKAGDKFITVTTDAGTVKSVSGNELTISEGTRALKYKDVTITIPSDATIYRNGEKADLGDLKADDRVMVSRSSDGTFVGAFDSDHRPPFRGHGPGHFGPPPPDQR